MAYTAANHTVFSDRMKNWVTSAQSLLEEAARLDGIYLNETVSGADSEFVDTINALKAEHQDVVTMMRAYKDFIENGTPPQLDRRPVMTPFLQ